MLFLFVRMPVIRAHGPLFASFRATAFISDSLASTESAAPTYFPAAVAPEAGCNQLQGPCRGPYCLHQHTSSWKPRAISKLIVSELTASLQKGLNACSLIIWILVNWINCWIETVLLKMTKTQGHRERKGGLISFPFTLGLKHAQAHTHTYIFRYTLPVCRSSSNSVMLFHTHINTHTQKLYVTQLRRMSARQGANYHA